MSKPKNQMPISVIGQNTTCSLTALSLVVCLGIPTIALAGGIKTTTTQAAKNIQEKQPLIVNGNYHESDTGNRKTALKQAEQNLKFIPSSSGKPRTFMGSPETPEQKNIFDAAQSRLNTLRTLQTLDKEEDTNPGKIANKYIIANLAGANVFKTEDNKPEPRIPKDLTEDGSTAYKIAGELHRVLEKANETTSPEGKLAASWSVLSEKIASDSMKLAVTKLVNDLLISGKENSDNIQNVTKVLGALIDKFSARLRELDLQMLAAFPHGSRPLEVETDGPGFKKIGENGEFVAYMFVKFFAERELHPDVKTDAGMAAKAKADAAELVIETAESLNQDPADCYKKEKPVWVAMAEAINDGKQDFVKLLMQRFQTITAKNPKKFTWLEAMAKLRGHPIDGDENDEAKLKKALEDDPALRAWAENPTPIAISLRPSDTWFLNQSFSIDLRGDGRKDRVPMLHPSKGWLVIDRNHNGMLDGGQELAGTGYFFPESGRDGFDALEELNSNHDDVVDARDPAWNTLYLWVDENSDGICQTAEMRRLDDLGIRALGVHPNQINEQLFGRDGVFADGKLAATATGDSGRSFQMIDVVFYLP